jgi:hypothetical protein
VGLSHCRHLRHSCDTAVGGTILASGLTLFVIPAIYSYFSKELREPRPTDEKEERAVAAEQESAVVSSP